MSNIIERPRHLEKPAPNKAVLTPKEFLRDIQLEAKRAKTRIIGQTMGLEPDEVGWAVARVFSQAPDDIPKELRIDYYTHLVMNQRLYEVNRHIPGQSQDIKKTAARKQQQHRFLRHAGVEVNYINPPKNTKERWLPITGRNHIKFFIIDDTVYIGGLNFEAHTAEMVEFMVKFTGTPFAAELAKRLESLSSTKRDKDLILEFKNDPNTWLLIDAGIPGKSVILDTAVDLIDRARYSIKNTAYVVPDGKWAEALKRALTRGVRLDLLSALSRFQRLIPVLMGNFVWGGDIINRFRAFKNRTQVPRRLHPRGVHAKLLIVDALYALFGSHNLLAAGVKEGTQEVALLTQDPELVGNLHRAFINYWQEADPKL